MASSFQRADGNHKKSKSLGLAHKHETSKGDSIVAIAPALAEWAARPDVVEQVVLESKYSGYIGRQADQVERFAKLEHRRIPEAFDYLGLVQLRAEAKEKLSRQKPASIGQASRISGITPADLAVILCCLE